MKFTFISLVALFLVSCGSSQNMVGIDGPERQTYKLFIEEEDYISQTPAMIHIDLIPQDYGFVYVRSLEGPGVVHVDSIFIRPDGVPYKHASIRPSKQKFYIYFGTPYLLMTDLAGDTISIPNEYENLYDVEMMNLVMKGIDTTGNKSDVPVILPASGNLEFFEIAEIRKDSTEAHWLTKEKVATSHRYTAANGTLYEAWYADDEILPIKMRLITSGSRYVYLRYVVEETED